MSIVLNLSVSQLSKVTKEKTECIITYNEINYPALIAVRGNSSSFQNKKGYNLTFENPVNFFNFGAYLNWSILGEAFDSTYIRNQLVYELGNQMGILSPVFKNFVLKTTELKGPFFYGLYSMTRKYRHEDIKGNPDVIVQFDRPSESDNIFPPQEGAGSTAVIENYNKNKFSKKEIKEKYGPIYENFSRDNIDYPSFVKNFIINEFSGNIDAHVYSAYSYVLPNDRKIISGYLWDFNLSFGNAIDVYDPYNASSMFWHGKLAHKTDVYRYYRNFKFACSDISLSPTTPKNYINDEKMYIAKTQTFPNDITFSLGCTEFKSMTAWYLNLLKDSKFRCMMISEYTNLRKTVLSIKNINCLIDKFSLEIKNIAVEDIKNWYTPILANVTNVCNPNNNPEKFYDENIKYMKKWISKRLDWLDENISSLPTNKTSLNNWDNYWVELNNVEGLHIKKNFPYKT